MSELLTVGQAATLAGVSVRTMRRRVAAGEVMTSGHGQGRRIVAASVGPRVGSTVYSPGAAHQFHRGETRPFPGESATGGQGEDTPASVTEGEAAMTEAMTEDSAASGAVMAGLVAVVDRLTSENRELSRHLVDVSTAAVLWQARAGSLSDRLALAERTLAQLQAPPSPADVSGAPERPDPFGWPELAHARAWAVSVGLVLVIVAGLGLVLMSAIGTWR